MTGEQAFREIKKHLARVSKLLSREAYRSLLLELTEECLARLDGLTADNEGADGSVE